MRTRARCLGWITGKTLSLTNKNTVISKQFYNFRITVRLKLDKVKKGLIIRELKVRHKKKTTP